MSKRRDPLAAGAVADQWKEFVRRMREIDMVPLVVLGFRFELREDGSTLLRIGSLWGRRIEESASDQERQQLESLLGDVSKLLVHWMEHDQARLD